MPRTAKTKTLLRECDDLCRKIVRARGLCEAQVAKRCTPNRNLQWCHGFSRSYHRIRHQLANSFCMCAACHMYFTHHPLEWDQWLHDKWGPVVYQVLRQEAINYGGIPVDLKETRALLQLQWAEIEAA